MNDKEPQEPKEPSVLDYLISMLTRQADKVELVEQQEATPTLTAQPAEIASPPSPPAPDIVSDEPQVVSIPVPVLVVEPEPQIEREPEREPEPEHRSLPWRTFIALLFAFFAQFTLDPTGLSFGIDPGGSLRQTEFERAALMGAVAYGIGALFLLWAYFAREFSLPSLPVDNGSEASDPLTMRLALLGFGGVLSLAAFITFTDNLFNPTNVTLWLVGLALYLRSLWLYERRPGVAAPPARPLTLPGFIGKWWDAGLLFLIAIWGTSQPNIFLWGLVPLLLGLIIVWLRDPDAVRTPVGHIRAFFKHGPWQITFTRWTLLVIAAAALVLFFRMYRIDNVLAEPFSDQAEKLLDVFDVTQGQTHIFFERNTGREFIQFYWTALMSFLFGTGLSFLSLKIGTMLIGLFSLPYIYLLGKEIGGKRVALFALILAGVAYWPNTISRVGLRFPLYMAFAAPTLYYLVVALRTQKRNYFILAGLFLGLGLHGYSPFRFVPFLVIAAVAIYLIHKQAAGRRRQVLILSGVLVLTSVLVFLPLGRYAMEHPEMFSERAFSRMAEAERPFPETERCHPDSNQNVSGLCILAENTYKAMMMFFWDNGSIWVHSIPGRPALDIAAAILFGIGYIFLFVRYLHKRRWQDLFMLVSVPLLLMPSILSLTFPGENPSLNRTSATAVTVFVIAGVALDGLYTSFRGGERSAAWRQVLALAVVLVFLGLSSFQSYDLMFNKFDTQFKGGSWNTSDIGKVVKAFMTEGNSPNNAWVVPYPYWVDTRLAGIQSGLPTKDFALDRDRLPETLTVPGSKLFIVKEEDAETMTVLRQLYPAGIVGKFDSTLEGKDFWIYTVPAAVEGAVP